MKPVVIMFGIFFFLGEGFAVAQSDTGATSQHLGSGWFPPAGTLVKPKEGVALNGWAVQPSPYFGTMFSGNLGELNPSTTYQVENHQWLPNVSGNQLWIQIKPFEDTQNTEKPCPETGCWAYVGKEPPFDLGVNAPSNFEVIPPNS